MLGETTEDFQHDFSLEDELPSNSAKDIITPEEPKEQSYYSDMSLDDISEAVDGFVENYNNIQSDLENFKTALVTSRRENDKLKEQIKKLKEELYTSKKVNMESSKAANEAISENKILEKDNSILQDRVNEMEEKIKYFTALMKKIYNSIPKK